MMRHDRRRASPISGGTVVANLAAPPLVYDAIIVGSGATGGWAAKQLTEAGLRVALLDAGRAIDPDKEFTEHQAPFQVKYRDRAHEVIRKTRPIQ